MAFSFQPFFPAGLQSIALANGVSTTTANIVQGGVNGTKIESLVITNTDTIDHALTIAINVASAITNVANVNIPAGAGSTLGVLPVNLFANNQFAFLPQDANGNKYLYLANVASSIVFTSNSVISTGKALGVGGQASVF